MKRMSTDERLKDHPIQPRFNFKIDLNDDIKVAKADIPTKEIISPKRQLEYEIFKNAKLRHKDSELTYDRSETKHSSETVTPKVVSSTTQPRARIELNHKWIIEEKSDTYDVTTQKKVTKIKETTNNTEHKIITKEEIRVIWSTPIASELNQKPSGNVKYSKKEDFEELSSHNVSKSSLIKVRSQKELSKSNILITCLEKVKFGETSDSNQKRTFLKKRSKLKYDPSNAIQRSNEKIQNYSNFSKMKTWNSESNLHNQLENHLACKRYHS